MIELLSGTVSSPLRLIPVYLLDKALERSTDCGAEFVLVQG